MLAVGRERALHLEIAAFVERVQLLVYFPLSTLIIAIASGGATVAPQAHDPVQARRRHGRSVVANREGCYGMGGILRDQAGGAQIVRSHLFRGGGRNSSGRNDPRLDARRENKTS